MEVRHGRATVIGRLGRKSDPLRGEACLVYAVPIIKYPANPPSIGSRDTIGLRTAIYFGQSFACFCGLLPGSITDEDSPFNECAHAYLAAARALLMQLRAAPGVDHDAVEALIREIEAEMLAHDASLMLCRYSDEPFNTNAVIWPHWSMIPFHAPTLAAFGAVFALIAGPAIWRVMRGEKVGRLQSS